jgi:hypothetical protein|tara:strand:+ start:2317 stop:2709 length:393 start_codon:yes stop_codon:yes gene_type:complete
MIAPTTPGTFATAAPVLCAGAEAEDVADEVREAEVARDDDCDALDEIRTDDEDADGVAEAEVVALRVAELDNSALPEIPAEAADETRERMNVGVTSVVGTALLRVGMTRELAPKKGAFPGSKTGPVSIPL